MIQGRIGQQRAGSCGLLFVGSEYGKRDPSLFSGGIGKYLYIILDDT